MHSVRGGGNSRIMSICQTERDRRELGAIRNGHVIVQHDYASELLENLTARERPSDNSIRDPEREIDLILERCREEHVEGVITTDDYPGTTLASVVAEKLNLAGPKPKANLICQHKFFSRQVQAAAAPEATPDFRLLDVRDGAEAPADHSFPLFVKPVKSFFSVGAQRVNCRKELDQIRKVWAANAEFFRPFEILLRKHTGLSIGTKCLIAEGLLEGIQTTLDGYVQHGEVHLMGVVDSIMFPGTIAFQRFEYPSSLPETVQQRMGDVARKVLLALEYNNGQFNIEFIYNPEIDTVHIVEINPRMSSQFADLFEKVDGTNSYSVLLNLALGKKAEVKRRGGDYDAAFSCVLRTFQNQRVIKLPSKEEQEKLQEELPGIRIEVLAKEGRKLSEQMQDTCSYRYGLLNIGGRDREEILEKFEYCKSRLTFDLRPV